MLEFSKLPLVEKIQIKLSDEKLKELISWLNQQKARVESDRESFKERQLKYLSNWDDFITYTRKGPWKESSNLHLPLTAIMVKSLHARFYEIFTNPSTSILNPRETSDNRYTKLISKLRLWYMYDYLNGYKGIKGFTREVFQDVVTVGFGVGIKDYIIKERKSIVIEPNELFREMKDLEAQVDSQGQRQMLETDEEMAKRANVSPYKEVQKILKVYEGTTVRTVPWENVYFKNDMPESNDVDGVDYFMIESLISRSDLNLRAEQGLYDKSVVKDILKGVPSQYNPISSEVKQERDRLSGINTLDSVQSSEYTLEQIFCTYDIDDDGFDEEIVVSKIKDDVVQISFLDRLSPSGMRPIVKFDCFSKARQGYSRGAVEYIYPIQQEIDHLHNKRQDLLTLQTTPFGVYRAGSALKKQPVVISPGRLIPADSTDDVKLLSWGANAQVLGNEQQILWQYAERMLSVTALTQGVVPDTVGPLRSTSGVYAMLKQMQKEFISSIEQNAQSWKKLEVLCMDDLDSKISLALKVKVLGPTIKDPSELVKNYGIDATYAALRVNGQFDIDIDVANASTSDEVRRNDAQVIMQALINPSIAQQVGVIGPKAIYKSVSDYLESFGKDPNDYIDEPELVGKALTLFQEIQICGQGEVPPMAMQDDHMGKAQQLMQFIQEPDFQIAVSKGMYVQDVVTYVQKAAQKHLALAQAMQPKGLPNPTGANNQNLNEQQASVSPQQGGQDPNKTTSREL